MGEKGDKSSNAGTLAAEEFLAKLGHLDDITSKKMFGGYGIFHDDNMFGMVNSQGEIFLKVNDDTKPRYEDAGATKHSRMPYYTMPPYIMEDHAVMSIWVEEAIGVAGE